MANMETARGSFTQPQPIDNNTFHHRDSLDSSGFELVLVLPNSRNGRHAPMSDVSHPTNRHTVVGLIYPTTNEGITTDPGEEHVNIQEYVSQLSSASRMTPR
jgi:hypothetical protein